MAFSTPDGVTIDSVSYVIAGPTNLSGSVDISQAQTSVEFVVGGLAAGAGYAITLSATTTNGDACSSGPAPFDILVGATTQVSVNLVCVLGEGGIVFADAGTGSVEVDATVTTVNRPTIICPAIAAFSVSPAEEAIGASSAVLVSTFPAGAPVSYTVSPAPGSSGDGTVTNVTATGATFTCTRPGQVVLAVGATAALPDGGTVSCPTMQALIDCESECTPGQTICGAVCVDLQSDPAHCGSCSQACPPGALCKAGACVPLVSMKIFPSVNYDSTTVQLDGTVVVDTISVGFRLPAGIQQQFVAVGVYADQSTQYLTNRVTWIPSDPALLSISSLGVATSLGPLTPPFPAVVVSARDPLTGITALEAMPGDQPITVGGPPDSCGSADGGMGCPCLNATPLAPLEGDPEKPCSGICVDQYWDPQHCGNCDTHCGPGESCNFGKCVPSCPVGPFENCGGICKNTRDDPANCHGCGNVCDNSNPFCCFDKCGAATCSGGKCPRSCM
jgi:hypothetical protein